MIKIILFHRTGISLQIENVNNLETPVFVTRGRLSPVWKTTIALRRRLAPTGPTTARRTSWTWRRPTWRTSWLELASMD